MIFELMSSSSAKRSSELVIGRISSTLLRKSAFRSTDKFTFGGRQAVECEKHALYFCSQFNQFYGINMSV